jgi:lipopolysaccharide export system protein LptC
MTAYSDQVYRDPGGEPPQRRLRYDPTRPVDEAAFGAARRHSARVRMLKIVLPVLAVIGAGVFWGTMHFVPTDLTAIAKGAGIDVNSNSVVMNKPRISGFEGTRRAYDIEADNAVQSLSDPKVVTFNKIDASIGLDGQGTATLNAGIGVYDGNHNTLQMKGGIAIATDNGYSATVDQAAVDLGAGSLTTSTPIEIKSAEGSIRANHLAVTERGKHVVFDGGVSVTYTPQGDLAAAAGAK